MFQRITTPPRMYPRIVLLLIYTMTFTYVVNTNTVNKTLKIFMKIMKLQEC